MSPRRARWPWKRRESARSSRPSPSRWSSRLGNTRSRRTHLLTGAAGRSGTRSGSRPTHRPATTRSLSRRSGMATGPSVRALSSSSSARRSRARTRRSSCNSRPTPTTPTRTGAATACTPTTAGTRCRAAACRSTGRCRRSSATGKQPFVAVGRGERLRARLLPSTRDLEFRPELLKHYKLVLSVGHDEYWSAPMRDNLEKFIGDGGNVAFFSGNTCCWQVRSEDDGRALACWKQAFGDDPHLQGRRTTRLLTYALEPLPRRPAGEHAHRRRLPVGRLPPQPRPVHGRPRRVHRPPARTTGCSRART